MHALTEQAQQSSKRVPVAVEPSATTQHDASPAVAKPQTPALAIIALNRLGYGPRRGDVAAFRALGATPREQLVAYLDQQLNPDRLDDSLCDQKLAAARMRLHYEANNGAHDMSERYEARDELLPLATLDQFISDLWPRALGSAPYTAWAERVRPADEVRVATWLRAVYSKRQLKEVLVDFWHNHFNVYAYAHPAIAATFPLYDQLMRQHALGNFRAFLEAVAQSVPMMYFLNNISNKAGGGEGGNENYARELFELHTLGGEHYLALYDDRESIGTMSYNGVEYVRGYIDRDVYEAARCLSGWTLDQGVFAFNTDWHDNALKIVLGKQFPYNQGIDDARQLFDMLARHPGTARFICTKLCRRLIADDPPASVIDAAAAVWMAQLDAPDQIAQVVRAIVLASAFETTWGEKLKRPFEFVASYLRAVDAELPNDVSATGSRAGSDWDAFLRYTGATGHKIFEWPLPTGYPDVASHWANTNSLLWRWKLPDILAQPWGGNIMRDLRAQTDAELPGGNCEQIVDYWIERLCGFPIASEVRQELIAFLAQRSVGGDPTQPPRPMNGEPNNEQIISERLNAMVQLLAMSPDFQRR